MTTYSLYKTFQDLVITTEDYQAAEAFAIQFLQAQYPTLDLRDGSALKDLLVRPAASLIALVVKGTDKHFRDNSISGVTDSSSEEVVNSMLSNFFLTRKEGTNAVLTIRLKFAPTLPGTGVTVPTSAYFSADNVARFYPSSSVTLSKNDNTLKLYTDATSAYWYGDIQVRSESVGDSYNLSSGAQMLYFTIFDPYFIGAEVVSVNTISIDKETNTQFIARSEQAISTRNLINDISIVQQFNEKFNYVKDVYVSGHGDYEQMRDYRELYSPTLGLNIPFHIGGYVDTYVRVPLAEKVVRVQADASGIVRFPTGMDPIYKISLPASGELPATMIDGSALVEDSNYLPLDNLSDVIIQDENYNPGSLFYEKQSGFSSRQSIIIYADPTPLAGNRVFDIKIHYLQYMSSVQAFLDEKQSRVVAANYVARGYNLVSLHPNLPMISTVPTDPTERGDLLQKVYDAAKVYVDSLTPGQSFVTSEMMCKIIDAVPEYQFGTAVTVSYNLYPSRVGVVYSGTATSNGVIDSDVVVNTIGHDESGTTKIANTFLFILNKDNISLTN